MRVAEHFHQLAREQGYDLQPATKLPWLTGRGHLEIVGAVPVETSEALTDIFKLLDGDDAIFAAKQLRSTMPDFRLGDQLVEFDEIQHFTIYRLATFTLYPKDAALGFDVAEYAHLCLRHSGKAGRGFAHKTVDEFPGEHSRARQRAYFDAFRDLVAPHFGNGPVIRVPAPDRDATAGVERFRTLLGANGLHC